MESSSAPCDEKSSGSRRRSAHRPITVNLPRDRFCKTRSLVPARASRQGSGLAPSGGSWQEPDGGLDEEDIGGFLAGAGLGGGIVNVIAVATGGDALAAGGGGRRRRTVGISRRRPALALVVGMVAMTGPAKRWLLAGRLKYPSPRPRGACARARTATPLADQSSTTSPTSRRGCRSRRGSRSSTSRANPGPGRQRAAPRLGLRGGGIVVARRGCADAAGDLGAAPRPAAAAVPHNWPRDQARRPVGRERLVVQDRGVRAAR